VIPSLCLVATLLFFQSIYRHSFTSPFIAIIKTGGSTLVNKEMALLTSDERRQTGSLWNTEATAFQSWEATFKVKIRGKGHEGAKGLAFWYVEELGAMGNMWGFVDTFKGIGVVIGNSSSLTRMFSSSSHFLYTQLCVTRSCCN